MVGDVLTDEEKKEEEVTGELVNYGWPVSFTIVTIYGGGGGRWVGHWWWE